MTKRAKLSVALLAITGLMAVFASGAQAHPNLTSKCSGCHTLDAAHVTITATFVSSNAAGTTYAIAVNNPYGTNGWGVYNGSSKIAGAAGNGTSVTVPNGITYTVYGVSGNNNGVEGYNSRTVSPVAPPVDTTAPTTTSDAVLNYTNSAAIHLSATDNVGGSGVASTYYILDSGLQTAGTTVNTSAAGAHTVQFWSVDVASNIETPRKSAAFTVTIPPPPDTTAPATTSDAVASYVSSAAIHLSATDNVGGSGVAHTYYILDSGLQTAGTTVNTSVGGAHILQFWSVDTASNIETPRKTAAFTVTIPPGPDTTAPTTTSDAVANYTNSATIHLSASDNAGGSGVAHTYYVLDSNAEAQGTTVSVVTLGAHTLEFWSVDTSGNVETPRKNASFEVTASAAPPVRVHRFYNKKRHTHFYTANEGEKERVIEHLSSIYTYEGVAYTINPDNAANSAPLYRFYNKRDGSHFYTASETEKNDLVATMSDTYKYEGVAYTVSTTPAPGSTTVYRFYNKINGSHFYTADEGEKNRVLTTLARTYVLDGPAYYVAP